MGVYGRDEALALLKEYTKDEGRVNHAHAVEACMRYFARLEGEDEDYWGIVGLLHDLDWERTMDNPEKHTHLVVDMLREAGYDDDFIHAVCSHGYGLVNTVVPESRMEKVLYTIDELTGLVITTALVRPGKSLGDLTSKSVKKKWKDKRFAAGVDRELIENGAAQMLGMDLNVLIDHVIEAMRPVERQLGLGE